MILKIMPRRSIRWTERLSQSSVTPTALKPLLQVFRIADEGVLPSVLGNNKYSILLGAADKPVEVLKHIRDPIVVHGRNTDEKVLDVELDYSRA
jgi:hypothetical protein